MFIVCELTKLEIQLQAQLQVQLQGPLQAQLYKFSYQARYKAPLQAQLQGPWPPVTGPSQDSLQGLFYQEKDPSKPLAVTPWYPHSSQSM